MEKTFEQLIVEFVLKRLPASEARFTNGTLYVECTVPEAVKLETALINISHSVITERVSKSTTAYDFV